MDTQIVLKELQEMRLVIVEQGKQLTQISEAVSGNPSRAGDKGISGDVHDHEERLEKLENNYTMGRGFIAGMMACASVVGGIVTFLITKLFNKQ